jgi:hypothetical protein
MWKHVRNGVLLGGIGVPIVFLIAAQFLASAISAEVRNEFLISLNALKVTFWPSSMLEMADPTSERNWELIGSASLVNAVLYGALGALFMLLRTTPRRQLTFWLIVVLLAGCAAWVLARVLWPVLVIGAIAAVHMVTARRRGASG